MSDDLDLRGIDHRYEPDPQFRAALQRRLAAIVTGTDPGSVTEATDLAMIDVEPTTAKSEPSRNRRWVAQAILAAAAVVAIIVVATSEVDVVTPADEPSPTVTVAPTVPPQPLPKNQQPLEPGTYYVDEVSGTPVPRIFATFGAGWWTEDTPALSKWDADLDLNTVRAMTRDEINQHEMGSVGFSQPAAVFLDACHTNDASYHRGPVTTLDGLVTALSEQKGWVDVTVPADISIDGYAGKAFQRTAPADMSGCDTFPWSPRVRTGGSSHPVFVSWVVTEADRFSGSGPYEPGQIETVWVIDIDGTMVVISTTPWPEPSSGAAADFAADVLDSIRIERPLRDDNATPADQPSPTVTVPPTVPPAEWSPELIAQVLSPAISCDISTEHMCPDFAVSPDGTLVAFDRVARTLTWYEDEPRVVSVTAELRPNALMAIGLHDIAYIHTGAPGIAGGMYIVAVAPSGAEITRTIAGNAPAYPTATGLVQIRGSGCLSVNAVPAPAWPAIPWVDLDGNPITDTRPYPSATATDAGIEVRLGEREWLLTEEEAGNQKAPLDCVDFRPRSDGGVVIVLGLPGSPERPNLLELLPDGTIERYYFTEASRTDRLHAVLPDGSLIVEHDLQLVRLTPPA